MARAGAFWNPSVTSVDRGFIVVMGQGYARGPSGTASDSGRVFTLAYGPHMERDERRSIDREIRAIVTACRTVPALNAWFDGEALAVTRHPQVDVGIAVDTDDGLFVPALRNADMLDARGIREGINRLRVQVEDRSLPASELSGYTISLSNFGMFAGRYATPVVVPPCVAIVGAGKLSHDVVAVIGGIEVHRRLPISLTFDHRAATGGEAARFLKALLDDMALPL